MNLKKANWIAIRSGHNVDDVYDVLLGNITQPKSLVNEVDSLSQEYDRDYDKGKDRMDSERPAQGGGSPR